MKVIKTKHTNTQVAERQEKYQTMPATVLSDGHTISCWALTDEEVQQVVKNRRIYLHQQTFNMDVQPVMIRAYQMLDVYYPYKMKFSGTSLAVCIACLVGRNAGDDLFNLQDSAFLRPTALISEMLIEIGYNLEPITRPADKGVYIIGGDDPRNPGHLHFCLYQDGHVVHDPHPANEGINTVECYYNLTKND